VTYGERIIEAVCRARAIESVHTTDGPVEGPLVFVWRANAAEQIEAALAQTEEMQDLE
jgi:hypothetical protein